MSLNWISTESIIYSELIVKHLTPSIKVVGFDLDHTIIKPIGKRVHPKDKNDYEYVFENVKSKMLELHNDGFNIIIFSNQSELHSKPEKKEIVLSRIIRLFKEVFDNQNIPVQFFISVQGDFCRKPNTGMMDFYLYQHKKKLHKDSFYVGDAAGRTKTKIHKADFSCSDRMFALNCKMNFMTPEQFFDEDDHRSFILDNTAQLKFMKEDKEGKMDKTYINWKEISKYNIIMFLGPPGSGKSSLSKRMVKEFNYTDIINMDTLRTKKKCINTFEKLLKLDSKRIIIDNTHSKKSSRKDYLDLVKKYKPEEKVLLLKLNVDKTQSFFLNNFRCKVEKSKRLSDIVIHSYFKYLDEPTKSEGFAEIIEIPFIPNFKGKPKERELFYQYF